MDQSVPVTFQKNVAAKVKASTSEVIQKVEQAFVKVEVDKAVDSLTNALNTLKAVSGEFNKIRPDIKTHQIQGEEMVTIESYSDAKLQERKKTQEKLQKLESAIAAFMESTEINFSDTLAKMNEAVQKCSSKGK